MAFVLKRKETASQSISRLLKRSAKKALDTAGCDRFGAIHQARKEIKKMRAVLRLVRHDISNRDCASRKARLQKAAKYLAPPRDAYIKAHTFESLLRKATARSGPLRFPEFQSHLKQQCREEMRAFERENCWAKLSRLMEKERACAGRLDLKHDGWCAIGPGLQKSYRAARRARSAACKDCSAVHLHDLRKRVKDLGYELSLLEPTWPEQMSALRHELHTLSDLLGDHHDLQALRHLVAWKSVEPDFENEANELLPIIDAQQRALSAAACKLGARLLNEKPADFCSRLHGYWKRWKKKKRLKTFCPTAARKRTVEAEYARAT